jgi:hypothetical protein
MGCDGNWFHAQYRICNFLRHADAVIYDGLCFVRTIGKLTRFHHIGEFSLHCLILHIIKISPTTNLNVMK